MTSVGGRAAASLCDIGAESFCQPDPWLEGLDAAPVSDRADLHAADWCSAPLWLVSTGYWTDRGWYDVLDAWRYDYLDQFQYRLLERPRRGRKTCETPLGLVAAARGSEWAIRWSPTTGHYLDRWRYVYLDEGRYWLLDQTQYRLLGGPRGAAWGCHRNGCGNTVALLPSRCAPPFSVHDPAIPEPCTAALFALGALLVRCMRLRNGAA
jgi:hypothetical protein